MAPMKAFPPLLCCRWLLLLVGLWQFAGVARAQDPGFGPDPFANRTKFEITYSGFDQISEVGADYVYGQPLTQQVETLGAVWDLRVRGFVLHAAYEQTGAAKTLTSVQEDTQTSDQMVRFSFVGSRVFVPYLGAARSLLATTYGDTSQSPALTISTRDELSAGFAGVTLLFPFAEGIIPFLGYARSSERFAIFSEITGLPIPDEVYEFGANSVEGGIILGREEGLHASWVAKQRVVGRVPGVAYALGGMTMLSQEVTVGYGSPSETGIEVGYNTSRQTRTIEDYFGILRDEQSVSLEFKINDVWLLKLSQSSVTAAMDFLLTTPVTNSRNHYRKNALTIVWRF